MERCALSQRGIARKLETLPKAGLVGTLLRIRIEAIAFGLFLVALGYALTPCVGGMILFRGRLISYGAIRSAGCLGVLSRVIAIEVAIFLHGLLGILRTVERAVHKTPTWDVVATSRKTKTRAENE